MTFVVWLPADRVYPYIVDGQTAFDVLHFMGGKLGVQPCNLRCHTVPKIHGDIELEWRGHDAGRHQGRFQWVRERSTEGVWGEWRRA